MSLSLWRLLGSASSQSERPCLRSGCSVSSLLSLLLFGAGCSLTIDVTAYRLEVDVGGSNVTSGVMAGGMAGVMAGVGAGMEAGVSAGVEAGAQAGVSAGVEAGAQAGVSAGVEAGAQAGVSAGVEAGAQAGVMAGVEAGTQAGVMAGVEAGTQAGVMAGVEAGTQAGVQLLEGTPAPVEVALTLSEPREVIPGMLAVTPLRSAPLSLACSSSQDGYTIAWLNDEGLHTFSSTGAQSTLHNNTFREPPQPLSAHQSLSVACNLTGDCALSDERELQLVFYTQNNQQPWRAPLSPLPIIVRSTTTLRDNTTPVILMRWDDGKMGYINGVQVSNDIQLTVPSPSSLPAVASAWPFGFVSLSATGAQTSWRTGAGATERGGVLSDEGPVSDWTLESARDMSFSYALLSEPNKTSLHALSVADVGREHQPLWQINTPYASRVLSLSMINERPWALMRGQFNGINGGLISVSPDGFLTPLNLPRFDHACLIGRNGQPWLIWSDGLELLESPL